MRDAELENEDVWSLCLYLYLHNIEVRYSKNAVSGGL